MAVQGGAPDADGLGDGVHDVFTRCVHLPGNRELLGGHDCWTPPMATPGASGIQTCLGALANELPLELGQRAEDVKDQAPTGSRSVDAFGQGAKSDPSLVEFTHRVDQMSQ